MRMLRPMAVAAVAAAWCFNASASHAYGDGPWCAVLNVGDGDVIWDCRYRSIEECQPNVISGNRGTCNLNPAWAAPNKAAPRKYRKRRVRH
jgi:hypothetical protein